MIFTWHSDFTWILRGTHDFHFPREKRKKSESRTRVDFSGGCKNIVFSKVLGRVSPPLARFLPKCTICGNGGNSTTFHGNWLFYTISAPCGGNGARAAPGWKHQRNLSFSYAFLGVPGTEKCVSGWIFTKNAVSGAFLVKITKMGGIPRNSTIFTKFPGFGRSRRPGPPKGHGIYMYYKGFGKVRRGQEKMLILHILPWNHIIPP